jgi:hypothetical protein
MKLLVVGYGRHGKDTVCDILERDYNLTFSSSSLFCAERFIFEALREEHGYESVEQCYEDRHNHRKLWFDLICEYNEEDASLLGREIFEEFDIYCGLRNKREFYALKNVQAYDYSIWVDRSEHCPPEPTSSMTIEPWMCDFWLDNNRGLKQLEFNVEQLMTSLIAREVTASFNF